MTGFEDIACETAPTQKRKASQILDQILSSKKQRPNQPGNDVGVAKVTVPKRRHRTFGKRRTCRSRKAPKLPHDPDVVRVHPLACIECSKELERECVPSLTLCILCDSTAHPECAARTTNEFSFAGKYKCPTCRTCIVCKNQKHCENSDLLNCSKCFKACHLNCDTSAKTDNVKGWLCAECRNECASGSSLSRMASTESKVSVAMSDMSSTSTSSADDCRPSRLQKSLMAFLNACSSGEKPACSTKDGDRGSIYPKSLSVLDNSDGTMAEIAKRAVSAVRQSQQQPLTCDQTAVVKSWSSDDLAQKLAQKRIDNCSDTIIRQCIDGEALLLLIREDVVRHLGLPLVQGLKLWRALCEIVAEVA